MLRQFCLADYDGYEPSANLSIFNYLSKSFAKQMYPVNYAAPTIFVDFIYI